MKKRIYLDHAATTPTDEKALKVMSTYLTKVYANASGLHAEGVTAKKALSQAREKVARLLEVRSEEIIFTSGGTESDNLALSGVIQKARGSGIRNPHIITTSFEHSAILETCKALEGWGVQVTYVNPEADGIVRPEKIIKEIKPDTVLVSVMYAQNEIGTIQPIRDIARAIKEIKTSSYKLKANSYPLFHTDACQAANYLDVAPNHLGVDLMTLAGSKIYGPKGSGILFARHGIPISPIMFGGEQERGLRPGTEPVYLAAGFAEALSLTKAIREKEAARLEKMRDCFIHMLLTLPGVRLNGHASKRLPNNVNVSIDGIDNEFFVIQLDNAGIACATRSACKTNEDKGSHVILSLGKTDKEAKESIRFSLGRSTTKKDIEQTLKVVRNL